MSEENRKPAEWAVRRAIEVMFPNDVKRINHLVRAFYLHKGFSTFHVPLRRVAEYIEHKEKPPTDPALAAVAQGEVSPARGQSRAGSGGPSRSDRRFYGWLQTGAERLIVIVDFTGTDYIVMPESDGSKHDPQDYMTLRGLDYSLPDSQQTGQPVYFCKDAWPVADLYEAATPRARKAMEAVAQRVMASRATDCARNFDIPADLELWPFQKASLDYVLSRQTGLIADEPGLGKTPMAIAYANEIKARSVLVIVPASVRVQWQRRIRQWSTMREPYVVYPVTAAKKGIHPTAEWVVISYSLASNKGLIAALNQRRFDLLIIDESHYLKSPSARRTRMIYGDAKGKAVFMDGGEKREFLPVMGLCDHVLCLSGTPIVNRPSEAYTTTRALSWDAIDFMSEDKFLSRFNPQGTATNGFKWERVGRIKELGNRMRGMFMTRHLKRDVMSQLKMPMFEVVSMEETKSVKEALRAESMLEIPVEELQTTNDYEILGHIASARKQMGVALAPQAGDYVAGWLDGGEQKIVVFAWHIEVMDMLQERLAKYGVVRVDGSTSVKKRQQAVDNFRLIPSVRIMLGNIQSMGTGVDGLQEVCTHCVIVEPSWTPGQNQQAVDRLDRGGQRGHVQADFLVAPGSLMEKILVSALTKAQTIHKTID